VVIGCMSFGERVVIGCMSFGERGQSAALWRKGYVLEQVKAERRGEAQTILEKLAALGVSTVLEADSRCGREQSVHKGRSRRARAMST